MRMKYDVRSQSAHWFLMQRTPLSCWLYYFVIKPMLLWVTFDAACNCCMLQSIHFSMNSPLITVDSIERLISKTALTKREINGNLVRCSLNTKETKLWNMYKLIAMYRQSHCWLKIREHNTQCTYFDIINGRTKVLHARQPIPIFHFVIFIW